MLPVRYSIDEVSAMLAEMTRLTVYVQRNIHRSYNFFSMMMNLGSLVSRRNTMHLLAVKKIRLDRDRGDSTRELNGPVKYQNDLQSG